jgi:DDE superfamily endonuclease
MFYACQDSAWMSEKVILMWVEKLLKQYVLEAPDHIVLILFLDSYRCHMMALVVGKFRNWVSKWNAFQGDLLVFVNQWMWA